MHCVPANDIIGIFITYLLTTADLSTGDPLIIPRKYPNASESELIIGDTPE